MIKKITLAAILLLQFHAFSQEKSKVSNTFDLFKERSSTKIVYNRVAPIANLISPKTTPITSIEFKQAFHEIQRADFLNRLPEIDLLEQETDKGFAENYIPLSILISEFDNLKPELKNSSAISTNNQNQLVPTQNINYFDTHKIGISGLLIKELKGKSFVINLKNELIFNTTSNTINKIEAKIDNGTFFTININKPQTISFDSFGKHTIEFKITLSNQQTFTNLFECSNTEKPIDLSALKNVSQQAPSAISPLTTITSSLTYQGYAETAAYAGRGEFQIFYDNEAGLLDKIILVCDGFDPGDSRKVPDIYNLLNYGTPTQNLGDNVRNLGYDVVVLNFPQYTRPSTTTTIDGGVDYIQRNARVMMELINYLNANKVGNQELVIIGPSMGGLISRYALRYMEQNGMDHKTRLWMSFDSPHLGANVPIGMQHMFNYLAYDSDISDLTVRAIVDAMLKSPAAREMLLDHFEGHLISGSLTDFDQTAANLLPKGHPTHRTPFQNELNTMGFPQNCRKIAISNGASNGAMTGTPGMTILNALDVPDSSGFTRALLDLNFTPNTSGNIRVSRVRKQAWTLFWVTIGTGQTNAASPSTSAGLDAAPGGLFNLESLAAGAGSNPTLTRFLNAMTLKKFDFIPARSSVGVTSTQNWYATINAASGSPFDAFYMPTASEDHVTLTPNNVTFAMNEIVNNIQLKCPNTTTWNGTSWSNGLPNEDTQVTFTGNYTSSGDLDACSITVSGTSIVSFNAGHNLKVRGGVNVATTAQLNFDSNANLYQIEEIANTGNAQIKRNTTLKRLDYAGWSSPVLNQNLQSFSPNTLSNRFYTYNPAGTSTPTAYVPVSSPSTTAFDTATGYLIRAENTMPTTLTSWTGTFSGVPNNGRINQPITLAGTGLGYNLVGNPYPTPLNINEVIVGNQATIDGTLYFWTNTNAAVGGVYTANNFATRNLTGGTAAVNGSLIPDTYIQSGQGFYVNALATGTMYFTNSMRNKTSNNQFINRLSTPTLSTVQEPENRIWINLSEGDKKHNQILVGYLQEASNNLDFGYDAKLFNNGSSALYSILNNEEFVIQAKGLPFNEDEVIPLGFKTQNSGTFSISLDHVDGIFNSQNNIYLKDNATNSMINLKENNYTFLSEPGNIKNRFEIRFKKEANTLNTELNELILFDSQNTLTVQSKTKIQTIELYDTLGRLIEKVEDINETRFEFIKLKKNNCIYIVNVKDTNGTKTSKKVIF